MPSDVARLERDQIDDLIALMCDFDSGAPRPCFDDLGEQLGRLTAAWRAGNSGRVVACAREVAGLDGAAPAGLLARVARDVVETGVSGDGAAFAATFARLVRLIEAALTAACSTPDVVL